MWGVKWICKDCAFRAAGGHWSTFIIWAKNQFTMGRADYQRQYEPILYGWKEGKVYQNGQFTLVLPMPFAIGAGDLFVAVAGCDKTINTCCNTFSNAANFRGEPYVPGMDTLLTTASTSSNLQ